ncbi:MAG: peptidylprolyl isomerase [Actinobacteria bacterium]|nr:peptidylprolyl isomerase [Actinomycetota bacterium]
MKRLPLSLALATAVLALVAAGCGGGAGDVPSDAVAVVDGIEIPRADLDELVAQAKTSFEPGSRDFPKVGTPEYQQIQQRYVAFLVQKTEFEQAAAAEFDVEITDEDVDKARADFLKSRSWDEKKLADELEKLELSEEGFRETLRVSVLSQKIFDAVTKDVKVSDQDALASYTQRQDEFRTKDSRDVRHILVSEKTKDGQIDFAKSKTEADRIYGLLRDGGDFAALARQFSEDPGSKDSGGKLTFSRGEFVAEFEKAAFELKTGEIAPPVKTVYGYHVIEALSDIRPAQVTPFKQVKDSIKAQLLQDKRNAAMTEWVKDLQKRYEGKVSYAAGFEPPELPESTATETE